LRDLLLACVVTIAIVSAFGFVRGDRLRLTKIDRAKGQPFTLVISMPDRDERYKALYYLACAAEITENGVYCIEGGWFTDGDRSISRSTEPIPFTNLPGGTLMFAAAAFDANSKTIASDRLVMMRGF
jgi:hypothetical protein